MVVSEQDDGEESPRFERYELISPIRDSEETPRSNALAVDEARRNLAFQLALSAGERNVSRVSQWQGERASQRGGLLRGRNNGQGLNNDFRNLTSLNAPSRRQVLPFPVPMRWRGFCNSRICATHYGRNPVRNPRPHIVPGISSKYRRFVSNAYQDGFSGYTSDHDHGNPLQSSEFLNGQPTPGTRRNESPPPPRIDVYSISPSSLEGFGSCTERGSGRRGRIPFRNHDLGRDRGSPVNRTANSGSPPRSTDSLRNEIRGRYDVDRSEALHDQQRTPPRNESSSKVRSFFVSREGSLPEIPDIPQQYFNPRDFNPANLTLKQSCYVMSTFDVETPTSTITRTLCMFTLKIHGLESCVVEDLRLAVHFFIENYFNIHPKIEQCVRKISREKKEKNVVGVIFEEISTKQEILANVDILNGTSYNISPNINVDWILDSYNFYANEQTDLDTANPI